MSSSTLTTGKPVGAIPVQRTRSAKPAGAHARRPLPQPKLPRPRRASSAPPEADAIAYLDFFYGFGAGPRVDLGVPLAYSHVPTAAGCVFREDFARGVALANCGDAAAEVTLERPYTDANGSTCTRVRLEPHDVVVLTN